MVFLIKFIIVRVRMNKNYITIGALNKYLKNLFERDPNLQEVYLKAEISNFKAHTRGHLYFTLKDETSRINAVMFSYNVSKIKFKPIDGMKVLVKGKIAVYEATGAYQIYVEEMEQDGLGNLYIEFEKLKKKLADEGLFDPSKKKKIPKVPRKIGIVTASTGAAIKDILTTIKRRFPICETILFPSLVQGMDAARDIVKNIEIANTYDIDTLIVGRGGGSIEDLWAFNEEIVAYAIYNSKIPIISAVGHEIDFTIADYVADLRAPTPTAAAELATPDKIKLLEYINSLYQLLQKDILKVLEFNKMKLLNLDERLENQKPIHILNQYKEKNNNLLNKLNLLMENNLNYLMKELNTINNNLNLNSPIKKIEILKEQLNNINDVLNHNYKISYLEKYNQYQLLISKLETLNPLSLMKQGYSVVYKNDNVITSINDVVENDCININLYDGVIDCKVLGGKKNG